MKNPANSQCFAPLSHYTQRVRLLASSSLIAATAFVPAIAHSSDLTISDRTITSQSAYATAKVPHADEARQVEFAPSRTFLPAGFDEFVVENIEYKLEPVLSAGLVQQENAIAIGSSLTFFGYSNYPAAVARGEFRIFDESAAVDGVPHIVLPMLATGAAHWTPDHIANPQMQYVFRVYDDHGNYDETGARSLAFIEPDTLVEAQQIERPDFGLIDSAVLRGIDLAQAQSITIFGRTSDTSALLAIDGQVVPLDADGRFATSLLQPTTCRGLHLTLTSPCGARSSVAMASDAQGPARPASAASGNEGFAGFQIREISEVQPDSPDYSLEVRADGHAVEPVMSVGLIGSERTVVTGSLAQFLTYTNYPSYIAKGEVRIFASGTASDSRPLFVVETDANGFAQWQPDATISSQALFYVFRVYDDRGRFDESQPQELTLINAPLSIDGAAINRPTFGVVDEARVRNIPMLKTATITVSGVADPSKETVRVSGQAVPINADGTFITQQLVDRDSTDVRITIENDGQTAFATTRAISVPRSDWFFVGQGDLTFRSMDGSDLAVDVSGDPLLDGNSLTSRAAFYTRGNFGDGWRLTASLDTGESLLSDMFNNLDRKDPRQLLRRLGSSQFYTTYGDDSTLVEDAPTQGQFYLKLQRADTSLMVGNYVVDLNQSELAPLDRGLFGIALDHKSTSTTTFGERRVQLTAFASDPGTVPGRDEFRGTGGSLYFLNRQDLTIGSERVRVEVRDRETGLVIETRDLRPQEDYDIDYFQGRVTLLRPLASTVPTSGTVRESSSTGNVPVLVVRYEYTPPVGSLDGYTLGGRGSAWIGDSIRLGLSAQRETTDTADQTLLAADAMLRLTAGTYLKGEVAQTDGPGFGQANSVDGGLSFTEIAAPGVSGRSARAWRLEGAINIAELRGQAGDHGLASAFYENRDAGFAASSQLTPSDTVRWGAAVSLPITQASRISAKYESLNSVAAGTHRTASVDFEQQFGRDIELKIGVRRDDQVQGLVTAGTEIGSRTDAAIQLGYRPDSQNWSIYGFGQATLERSAGRERNNRAGVGVTAEITDRTSLSAELSEGDGGLGAGVQFNRRYGQGSEAYIGYSLLADRSTTGLDPVNIFTRSNAGTLTVGARHRFSTALSIYGENRIGHGGVAPSTMRSLGLRFDPNNKLSFSASFENGRIDDPSAGSFRRTAATVGVGYTTAQLQLGSNIEARFEQGSGRDQKVWLFRNTASIEISNDLRALGRFNLAIADNEGPSVRAADYVEGTVGFAYRPVANDRLNVLARYSYFQDLGPVGQITAGGETSSPRQRSQIGMIDVNYDLSDTVTVGAKYGYRQGEVSLSRESNTFVSSNTHLGVLRLDWRPVEQWDLVVEGRYLSNNLAGDQRIGGLAAIYRHLGNNVKVGIGYSVSDFSDNLADQSYSSRGLFINLLSKF